MRLAAGRRALLGVALAVVLATPAIAGPPPDAPPDEAEILAVGVDGNDRMTVDVRIGGAGPHAFLVDTGSERTVISTELAAALGLRSGRKVRLQGMTGTSMAVTVRIPSLELSSAVTRDIDAPAIDQAKLGAVGMLGIDSLSEQRVLLDFDARTMAIGPATRREAGEWGGDIIVVRARTKLGQLILTDAEIDGRRIRVVIDTGAQVSVGNSALRRLLTRRGVGRETRPIELVGVTGGRLPADYTTISEIRIGGMRIEQMPVAFADAHAFRAFGLAKRPALLLGMDALRMFDRVSIDFANRRVSFLLPDDPAALAAR